MTKKDFSIEYAHIYTNNHVGDEQRFSVDILQAVTYRNEAATHSLVVLVDDYSFPDPSFSYGYFIQWLKERGFEPDVVMRESQLIPICDKVLSHIMDGRLRNELIDYIRKAKKYPCSLFIASWYMLRLGLVQSPIFDTRFVARRLINILPLSFKLYEEKAFDIIRAVGFTKAIACIENKYFKGREIT